MSPTIKQESPSPQTKKTTAKPKFHPAARRRILTKEELKKLITPTPASGWVERRLRNDLTNLEAKVQRVCDQANKRFQQRTTIFNTKISELKSFLNSKVEQALDQVDSVQQEVAYNTSAIDYLKSKVDQQQEVACNSLEINYLKWKVQQQDKQIQELSEQILKLQQRPLIDTGANLSYTDEVQIHSESEEEEW